MAPSWRNEVIDLERSGPTRLLILLPAIVERSLQRPGDGFELVQREVAVGGLPRPLAKDIGSGRMS